MGKPSSKLYSTLKSVSYTSFTMKAPSVRDFSVFSYLRNLGPLQLRNLHIRLLEENFEKIRQFH